jgi:uncharacterized protein (TIGR00730 family)
VDTNSSPANPVGSPAGSGPSAPAGSGPSAPASISPSASGSRLGASPALTGRRVSVLGSARLSEDSPDWETGLELGRLLATAGFTVITGGYGGLMEAVSRGAAEAGGHVVGLAMKSWTSLSPNSWNTELAWADGYPARLASMLDCHAVIALAGGVGTLSELAVAWAARQTEPGHCPIVLVGERWRRLVDEFARYLVIDSRDLTLIHVVGSPTQAVDAVLSALNQEAPAPHPRG